MTQYREIFTIIDSAKGTLINQDGSKISRDEQLPRLILADEVILYASFVNVSEEKNVIAIEPKKFDRSMAFKIIGDHDGNDAGEVMFSYAYLPEKSDFDTGRIAFHIKSNSPVFAEAVKNSRIKKCDFVILGIGTEPVSTVVLAMDQFIAEKRPLENTVFEDIAPAEIMSREELQLLLDLKSPLEHTHTDYAPAEHLHGNYAAKEHQHDTNDISDLENYINSFYTAGDGISIENNVISCTVENGGNDGIVYSAGDGISIANNSIAVDFNTVAKKSDIVSYSAGNGISISNGVISCNLESGKTYTAGTGLNLSNNSFSVNTDIIASREYVDDLVGNIDSILDSINGEEL